MSYFRRRGRYLFLSGFLFVFFNFYFIVLMRDKNVEYLLYLDFLVLVFVLLFVGVDFFIYHKKEMELRRLMRQEDIICRLITDFENSEVAEHDVRLLQDKLQEKFDENCELQDYVAKWCHELKIPLSAALLIDEKIKDGELRTAMREQLEKINWQVSTMLQGCRLQSALFDLQIKRTSLSECVKASIRNNRFFLIQKKFAMDIQVEELPVYTDPVWLVYVLDQLLNNAIKYAGEEPALRIWAKHFPETDKAAGGEAAERKAEGGEVTDKKAGGRQDTSIQLFIEDNGEGIRDSDIRRIFEKGYTGSSYHNGKYKSTGMGLYLAAKIIGRLEHEISVESEYGEYTRFCITFRSRKLHKL